MKVSVKILHWVPRILCILAIIFISAFALDSFAAECTFRQNLRGFLMHLVPSYILIGLLIVAWNWEVIGGIIFTIIGLGMSPFIYIHNFRMSQSTGRSLGAVFIITMPFILVGVLFIVSHCMKKKLNNIA